MRRDRGVWRKFIHDDILRKLWNSPLTLPEISEQMGFCPRALRDRARQLDLPRRIAGRVKGEVRNRERDEAIKAKYAKDKKMLPLIEEYKLSYKRLWEIVNEK